MFKKLKSVVEELTSFELKVNFNKKYKKYKYLSKNS